MKTSKEAHSSREQNENSQNVSPPDHYPFTLPSFPAFNTPFTENQGKAECSISRKKSERIIQYSENRIYVRDLDGQTSNC